MTTMSPIENNNVEKSIKQPLIAGYYARVSTALQENEATIESQIDEICTRIKADGNVLPQENRFQDDGWTGSVLQRPGLDTMRDAAAAGRLQILYVYDMGRIARKYHYQAIILEELEDLGIRIMSLHDKEVHDDMDRVLQAMEGVFHEYERAKIAERFRRGKLYRARQKVLINGQALYGYTRIKRTDDAPARLIVNEKEADVIRKIFHWFVAEGLSLREIRRRLAKEGIPPRKGKQKYWTKGPISRLLQCKTYVNGIVYFNKSEAVVAKKPKNHRRYQRVKKTSRRERDTNDWIPCYEAPIILKDKALFEQAQERLQKNKREKVAHPKYEYLLTGLVWCGCGLRRSGDGSSRHGHCYYRCTERIYSLANERKCNIGGINAAALDFVLWNELAKYLDTPELLREHAQQTMNEWLHNNGNDQQASKLSTLIKRTDAEMNRYIEAYGTGAMDLMQFQQAMKEVKRKKHALNSQIQAIRQEATKGQAQAINLDDLCTMAVQVIKELDLNDKKAVIREVVDKVIIREDNDVEVCGHISLKGAPVKGLGSCAKDRNSRTTKRGEINPV